MRRFFEHVVSSLPLDPRSRRVLDETLHDWRFENESIEPGLTRRLNDLLSAIAVVRALVLVSWWKPNAAIAQSANGAPLSERDQVIDVINKLSPDSSYEDILREIARAKAAKGEPGMAAEPPRRSSSAFWGRAARVAAVCVCVAIAGATIQTYATPTKYQAVVLFRVEADAPPAGSTPQQAFDLAAFMTIEQSTISSRPLALRVVRALKLAEAGTGTGESPAESRAVDQLSERLAVWGDPKTRLIRIIYTDSSSDRAARIANAIAEHYVSRSIERRRQRISEQLNTVKTMVDSTSVQLEGDRRLLISRAAAANVVDPSVISANLKEAQRELTARQYEADSRKLTAEEMRTFDLENRIEGAMNHPDLQVATLRKEYLGAINAVAALKGRGFGPAHPQLQQAESHLAGTKAELKAEIQRHVDAAQKAYERAETQRKNAERALKYQQAIALENSRNAIPFSQLRERITASERRYQLLLTQQNQLEMVSAGIGNHVSIAETSTAALRAGRQHTSEIFSAWIAAGLLIAVIAAVVMRRRTFPGPKRPGLRESGVVSGVS
jgi:uncharacterized protein involved in exopolysaccharide biosynthesis